MTKYDIATKADIIEEQEVREKLNLPEDVTSAMCATARNVSLLLQVLHTLQSKWLLIFKCQGAY